MKRHKGTQIYRKNAAFHNSVYMGKVKNRVSITIKFTMALVEEADQVV